MKKAVFNWSGEKDSALALQADLLDETYIGKDLDANLIASFPKDIDVCGENGEYHTLSYAGSLFKTEVEFTISKTIKTSFDFTLDTGEKKTFEYWQAEFHV